MGKKSVNTIEDPTRRYIVVRMMNKLMLQQEKGLEVNPDRILFCMIHRISEQKGFQLLLDASEGVFKNLGFQAIIGGAISSGDNKGEELAHGLYLLSQYYSEDVNVSLGFQDVAVPLLCSDIFGMPSLHEPGGISQLEAFAAGCLVVARATGGLRDTVFPVQVGEESVTGNGFLFSDFTPWAFYDAMERAHQFFTGNDENTIYSARVNAENSIYFWDTPAKRYINEIYKLAEKIRILQQ
jgi:starch synthase